MRGLFFGSLLCIVLCMQGTNAQWPKWVLEKGKTCEDRCSNTGEKCSPVEDFNNCKCFPQLIVDNWRQYHSLPIDPSVVCVYLMSSSKAPKCCSFYEKQEDFYKNSVMEMASRIGNQSQEIEELVNRSQGMGSIILKQNQEVARLKSSLSYLVTVRRAAVKRDYYQMKQLSEQNRTLESLKQAFAKQPWKQVEKAPAGRARGKTCLDGWSQSGVQCYKLYNQTKMTWNQSKILCKVNKAYLASIESRSEQRFMESVVAGAGGDVWLDGTDGHSEGNWVWQHTNTTIRYTNWHGNQPNNGGGNENCMVAWGNRGWLWADRSCDKGNYCLCEKTVG